jgi:molybdopterin-containing oxidoreductase family membrane subunit
MPVGLLFYGTNGAFFAILANRPLWNSSLTPLLFIVAALLSGGALIAFLSYTFHKDKGSSACIGTATCIDLGQVLKYLLILFLALEVMQFSVGYVSAKPNLVAVLDYILVGPSWWVFWIVHLSIGSLIPLAMLIFSGGDPKKVAVAAFLIVITFVAVRYDFVVPEFSVYPLDGLQSAFVHPRLSTAYSPNLNEWLVSVWIVSLGLLAFTLGVSRIPVLTKSNGGKDHE